MNKISYSAWKKWLTCPKMFDYHYNERLRPTGTTSALMFGSAIDSALNHLLLTGEDPVPVFKMNFEWEDLQGVEWNRRDFDIGIFDPDQLEKIEGQSYDYQCWASMRCKGRLLLEAYLKEVYPNIEEVYDVQKEVSSRPGFLDARVKYKGYGKVLLDHKALSNPLSDDATERAVQLLSYAHNTGDTLIGYVALVKQIGKTYVCVKCGAKKISQHKTCPKVVNKKRCYGQWKVTKVTPKIQVIIGETTDHKKKIVEESFTEVENALNKGIYPRNLEACWKMYGKPCVYYKKCWNDDESGLEYKKEEKK